MIFATQACCMLWIGWWITRDEPLDGIFQLQKSHLSLQTLEKSKTHNRSVKDFTKPTNKAVSLGFIYWFTFYSQFPFGHEHFRVEVISYVAWRHQPEMKNIENANLCLVRHSPAVPTARVAAQCLANSGARCFWHYSHWYQALRHAIIP